MLGFSDSNVIKTEQNETLSPNPTNVEKVIICKQEKKTKQNNKNIDKMFTDLKTAEAAWSLKSSKIAEPNAISLPWNFCCIATKFREMRNKHKVKKKQ